MRPRRQRYTSGMSAVAPTPPLDGARLDFRGAMSYGDYLGLDALLSAQRPRSPDHNELLFIIQHQASELWMKLMLHELTAARARVRAGDLQPAFKMLARVSRILAQLVQAWDVLSTLTPAEYSAFRHDLGDSSGFQSYQYRMLEFLLGNKNRLLMEPHRHRPDLFAPLAALCEERSLYDEAIVVLARRGFAIDAAALDHDFSAPYVPNASVEAAWVAVYRDPDAHWDLYQLAEKLVDLEDAFRQWRFRHLTTVERVIGYKRGTGGTAGTYYLRHVLDTRLFPELWNVRTHL